jgi:hypothetical protein
MEATKIPQIPAKVAGTVFATCLFHQDAPVAGKGGP